MMLRAALAVGAWLFSASAAAGGDCRGASSPEQSVAELNQMGAKLFASERPREAAEYLRRSLQLNPRQQAVAKLLGLSCQLANDPEGAEGAFRRAIEIHSRDGEPWFYLGRLYYEQNFFDQAREALHASLELNSRDHRPHYCLALTLEAEGQTDASEAEYGEAIRWNQKREKPDAGPHLSYGVLLTKLGRLEEGEKQLLLAEKLQPGGWQPCFELGKLYYRKGDLKSAEQQLTAALQNGAAGPQDQARVCHLLARVYIDLGRDADAERVLAEMRGKAHR
jgi:Flp pilus assembly protein TadD